jgi:hypothetical protein
MDPRLELRDSSSNDLYAGRKCFVEGGPQRGYPNEVDP